MSKIHFQEKFEERHIGPSTDETAAMLDHLGVSHLDELIDETLPAQIRATQPLHLPSAQAETAYLRRMKAVADKNKVFKSYIGQGYYDVVLPGVIQRNVFENPGWYTQYTPYQAEIAQGRLQALLNFQTMVIDLTGMEIANASLLDEATAAAEAMFILCRKPFSHRPWMYYIPGHNPTALSCWSAMFKTFPIATKFSAYWYNIQRETVRFPITGSW